MPARSVDIAENLRAYIAGLIGTHPTTTGATVERRTLAYRDRTEMGQVLHIVVVPTIQDHTQIARQRRAMDYETDIYVQRAVDHRILPDVDPIMEAAEQVLTWLPRQREIPVTGGLIARRRETVSEPFSLPEHFLEYGIFTGRITTTYYLDVQE